MLEVVIIYLIIVSKDEQWKLFDSYNNGLK